MEYPYLNVYDDGKSARLLEDVDLSVAVAEKIRSFPGTLVIDDINILPLEFVLALAEDFKGSGLSLYGNFEITPEAAEALSKVQGELYIADVEKLSDEAIAHFARHSGYLGLNGLISLSEEAAAALAKHEGVLDLNCLTEISEAGCLELAKHRGGVSMDELDPETLTPAAIEAFKKAWPEVWGNV